MTLIVVATIASWLLGVIFFTAIVAGAEKQHRQERRQATRDRIKT